MKLVEIYFFIILVLKCLVAFPDDLKPNLVLSSKDTNTLSIFNGDEGFGNIESDELEIQQIFQMEDKILITSINAAYVVSKNSFSQTTGIIAFDQILRWLPNNSSNCLVKRRGGSSCGNYIRIAARMGSGNVLLCGTNAGRPTCRGYQWRNSEFTGNYLSINKKSFSLPLDSNNSLAYTYFDGNLFVGLGFSRRSSSIRRLKLSFGSPNDQHRKHEMTANRKLQDLTISSNSFQPFLRLPHFVGTVDTSEKVFFFFREEAFENSEDEKVIYSRVAQVCKNDAGEGSARSKRKWTSFFKARLNCSYSGERLFYFDEITHVTNALLLNGRKTVLAIFTTPKDAIPGAAVCAFTDYNITKAMAGNFMEFEKSSSTWRKKAPYYPSPHPTNCKGNFKNNKNMMEFINQHFIMTESVEPLGGAPLFVTTQTKMKLTAIAGETNVRGVNGENVTVLYIGTDNGNLLKISIDQDSLRSHVKSTYSEKWDIFRSSLCQKRSQQSNTLRSASNTSKHPQMQVEKITVIPGSDFVLVSFKHCIISVPKKACWHYKCKRSCLYSGSPFCGWDSKYCIPVNVKNSGLLKQDLFTKKSYAGCSLQNEKPIHKITSTEFIATPLFAGLIGSFVFWGFLFFLYVKFRNRCSWLCCSSTNDHQESSKKGEVMKGREGRLNIKEMKLRNISSDRSKESLQINTDDQGVNKTDSPKIKPQISFHTESTNQVQTGTDLNPCNVNETPFNEEKFSCDDTVWSEESDCSFTSKSMRTEMNVASQQPLDGNTYHLTSTVKLEANRGSDCPIALKSSSLKCDLLKSNVLKHSPVSSPENLLDFKCSSFLSTKFKAHAQINGDCSKNVGENSFSSSEKKQLRPPTKLSLTDSSSHHNKLAFSASGESTSSGFLSFSPPSCSVNNKSWSNEIDSNTTKNALASSNHNYPSYQACSWVVNEVIKGEVVQENIYDEVARGSSESGDDFSRLSTPFLPKKDKLPISYPSPEFCCSSEDEDKNKNKQKIRLKSLLSPQPQPTSGKSKKMLKLFKSKKNKQLKSKDLDKNDLFLSPSFEEDLVLPVLEGWKEIDLDTSQFYLQDTSCSLKVDPQSVGRNNHFRGNSTGFLTMVPRQRQRQKISRFNSCRQTNANNKCLVSVPTPALPSETEHVEFDTLE